MRVYGTKGQNGRTLAWPLLERAVREMWGLEELPELARTERGKPFFPKHPELHFNLSHSGGYALCALGDSPVGIDIQIIKPFNARLLDRVCSPEERRWLRERGDQDGDFAQIWAGKESLCKQWGTGLQFPLGELRAEQEIFTFYQGENWRGALCARKAGPEEIIWISDLHLERRGV